MTPMAENNDSHTYLMRFGFGLDESRAYWERRGEVDGPPSVEEAFENHWFGMAAEGRVSRAIKNMILRYDAYPDALALLVRWHDMAPATRRVIVHWHMQLADPTYRAFTGDFLHTRREAFEPRFERFVVDRWIDEHFPGRWAISTRQALAGKLIGAAFRAGLLEGKTDPRTPVFPRVTDEAIHYGIRLFRQVELSEPFYDNAYLRSVGLSGSYLAERLRPLDDASLLMQGDMVEFVSATPRLSDWWEARAA